MYCTVRSIVQACILVTDEVMHLLGDDVAKVFLVTEMKSEAIHEKMSHY